ncbi:hypothetical protein BJV78DRAFT_1172482 [Lactifluus subvellereus]|nr:hypothetical protein BJV78DRAFT_1172482 [Lactifluus subvellereus]
MLVQPPFCRLSLSPHKWLKYVMFAICGAHGVLATVQGQAVQDDTDFADISESYLYTPYDMHPRFIDYQALNDRVTSTTGSRRAPYFRGCVMTRDGSRCIVTRADPDECDAAHIIPKGKGDAYIQLIVQSRRDLYYSPEIDISISSIDDVRNGILVRKDLHCGLGRGKIAFLKTPNSVLSCDDIPREGNVARTSQDLSSRITMQHLVEDLSYAPVPDLDAHLTSAEELFPPAIILDYVYGAAAYQLWKSNQQVHEKLQTYFTDNYQLTLRRWSPGSEPDDDCDADYVPGPITPPGIGEDSDGMWLDPMDEMNLALMIHSGVSLKDWAANSQQQQEEEEERERGASQAKVMEWIGRIEDIQAVAV